LGESRVFEWRGIFLSLDNTLNYSKIYMWEAGTTSRCKERKMAEEVQEIGESPYRKYFTIFPNLYDDLDLTPYEFRLICHYLRRGETWETIATTARVCGMSKQSVRRARATLVRRQLITTELRFKDDGSQTTILINVVDIWPQNVAWYGEHVLPVHMAAQLREMPLVGVK
jgi:hypothetical protein